jgi:hypothetical protein
VGTNRQYVADAERIRLEDPDLFDQVRHGRLTIPKALKRLDARQAESGSGEVEAAPPEATPAPEEASTEASSSVLNPGAPPVAPAATEATPVPAVPQGDGQSGNPELLDAGAAPQTTAPVSQSAPAPAPAPARSSAKGKDKKQRTDEDAFRDLQQASGLLSGLAGQDRKRVGRFLRHAPGNLQRWQKELGSAQKALQLLQGLTAGVAQEEPVTPAPDGPDAAE